MKIQKPIILSVPQDRGLDPEALIASVSVVVEDLLIALAIKWEDMEFSPDLTTLTVI